VDRLRSVEVFTKVVELGSFTAAAQAMRLPRATATAAVQELEARLQVKLLHRTTRRVTLTPDGSVYYEEAGRLLRELAELETSLGRSAATPRGRVRVDVPAAAGRHVIAPALGTFLDRYPDVVVEIGSTDRPVDLVGEGVDVVIRGGDLHDDTLAARKLGELAVVTCAAPAYLARRGTPRAAEDLADHHFVSFFSAKTGRHFDVDFARDGVEAALPPRHRVAANDTDTWLALALAGLGLLQIPAGVAVRSAVERGELVRLLPEWSSEPLPLYVLYPRVRHLPARVRAFVDWVVELYREECRLAAAFVGDPG
jgi:LysR family transcriptional regulator for bpeEF and oprC